MISTKFHHVVLYIGIALEQVNDGVFKHGLQLKGHLYQLYNRYVIFFFLHVTVRFEAVTDQLIRQVVVPEI